jgi:hypothetical protein
MTGCGIDHGRDMLKPLPAKTASSAAVVHGHLSNFFGNQNIHAISSGKLNY